MKRIEHVTIVGMGALGMMYGQRIQEGLGREHLQFLMEEERKAKHAQDRYIVNGEELSFKMVTPGEAKEAGPADLVIAATKYSGLYAARELMGCVIGPDTVIVSVMNGITSEEILAEVYPREQILDCCVLGMDAVREGTVLTYTNFGRWQIGSSVPGQEEYLDALKDLLERAGIPYEVCGDIRRALWNKFMLNVGINQTCMVYETGYGVTRTPGKALDDMTAAMREVITIAQLEGIGLTEEDCQKNLAMLRTLEPENCPSMRQDAMAKRKSEVELFAGTVLSLARKHQIEAPVNEKYYRIIREMEENYASSDQSDAKSGPADLKSDPANGESGMAEAFFNKETT